MESGTPINSSYSIQTTINQLNSLKSDEPATLSSLKERIGNIQKILSNYDEMQARGEIRFKAKCERIEKIYTETGIYAEPFKPLNVDFATLELDLELTDYDLKNNKHTMRDCVHDVVNAINAKLKVSEYWHKDSCSSKDSVRHNRKLFIDKHYYNSKNMSIQCYEYRGNSRGYWYELALTALQKAGYVIEFEVGICKLFSVQI